MTGFRPLATLSALAGMACLGLAGRHPAARPHAAASAAKAVLASPTRPASAAPIAVSASGFPTPEEAFKQVRFREPVEPAQYGHAWRPEKLVPIRGGFALLMSWAQDSCASCDATLGVAYFHRTGGRWLPYGLWENVYQDGKVGEFSGIELIDIGQPNPTVALHGGFFSGGCDVDAFGLVELAPAGPILRIADAPLGSSNGGDTHDSAGYVNYQAAIAPLKGRQGLKIRYWGEFLYGRPLDVTVVYTGAGSRWAPLPRTFRGDCAGYWRHTE